MENWIQYAGALSYGVCWAIGGLAFAAATIVIIRYEAKRAATLWLCPRCHATLLLPLRIEECPLCGEEKPAEEEE